MSLRDSAYAYSPLDDIEYEPSAYASTVPTHRIFLASDVLLFICKILNADRAVAKMCKVVDVKLACPTAIAVSFQDVSAALCAFRVLSAQSIVLRKVSPQEAARKGKGPAIVSIPLTDLLELLPAFNPADPLLAETLAQKIEMEAAKRDQITLDASDSHVAVVSDDSGQTNQLSNTDWLAMKTATRNNVATISKETSKPTVLDAELIANIQNEWEADAISDDTFIAEESNVVESTAMSSGKEVITTADVDVDAVGKAESSASLRNAMSNQFPTSDGTYKRLVLQPRSSDLPPPLPPMPLVKKAELKDTSTFPRPKTTKVASTTSETDNKKKPAVNKFAAFSSTGEEEDSDSDDDDEGEGFLDPYDNVSSSIVPCAEGGDSVVTDSESNSIQLSEVVHRMWTCQTCTLNNSVYVPVHQRELECDACLTVWRPLS